MMPRSRQISISTAPIGRRRISAAICAVVGRRARHGSGPCLARLSAARRSVRGCDGDAADRASGPASRAAQESCPRARGRGAGRRQCATGSARCRGCRRRRGAGGAVGEAARLERGGEFLAVVDELADEAEQAGETAAPVGARRPGARRGCGVKGVGCGWHERNKAMNGGEWQGKYSGTPRPIWFQRLLPPPSRQTA